MEIKYWSGSTMKQLLACEIYDDLCDHIRLLFPPKASDTGQKKFFALDGVEAEALVKEYGDRLFGKPFIQDDRAYSLELDDNKITIEYCEDDTREEDIPKIWER
jgi:hypothetical protein